MKVIADTNVIISGLLWRGAPRSVLDAARAGRMTLFVSADLLAELDDVLNRPRFAEQLKRASVLARDMVLGYAALATVIVSSAIPPAVPTDPDDDAVLACAVAAQADLIVSGDSHLLALKEYQSIPIVTAAELLARLL